MARRNKDNEVYDNSKRDVNEKDIIYYISAEQYILPCKSNTDTNSFLQIGDFFNELIRERVIYEGELDLKVLRKWDEKEILPAYRKAKGPVRTETRFYTRDHINMVKEILRLKRIGFNISDIEKILFFNESVETLLLEKSIKNKEDYSKMKKTMNNMEDMETRLIAPSIETVMNINFDKYDTAYKCKKLKKEYASMIAFVDIVKKACSSYNEGIFNKSHFKEEMINIISKYKKII